jgi:hypothetical protein
MIAPGGRLRYLKSGRARLVTAGLATWHTLATQHNPSPL